MSNNFMTFTAMAAVVVAIASPALAGQGGGSNIEGKVSQTVTYEKPTQSVAIGPGAKAIIEHAVVRGSTVKGDITQTVVAKSTLTSVAIGPGAEASIRGAIIE